MKDYNKLSEEEFIKLMGKVSNGGNLIKHLTDPSEALKIAAVRQHGSAIRHIKNPSAKIKIAAIDDDPEAIIYLDEVTSDLLKRVLSESMYGFHVIYPKLKDKITEDHLKFFVEEHYSGIAQLINPSEDVQLASVTRFGTTIKFITNPSEKVQLAAIEKHREAFFYIKNPTDAACMAYNEKIKSPIGADEIEW